jgi:hypothetical protein
MLCLNSLISGSMKSVISLVLTLCSVIFVRAQKQKSWVGPNKFIAFLPENLASPFSSLVTESNGKVYGFGGHSGAGGNRPTSNDFPQFILVFILTPKSATATAPLDNRFYEYDPSSRTWSDLTDVSQFGQTKPPARKAHGLSSSNGKLYMFGGETNESGLICR